MRIRPPFSPELVVAEFAALLKVYRISRVTGDRYAGEWPRERFRAAGIQYDLSIPPKGEIYLNALPLLNSGKLELLDISRLANQLCGLERRTARGGRDSIDHAPGGHDDVANAVAGALLLTAARQPMRISPEAIERMRSLPSPVGGCVVRGCHPAPSVRCCEPRRPLHAVGSRRRGQTLRTPCGQIPSFAY